MPLGGLRAAGAAQQEDHVGVLLDGARVAQVRELRHLVLVVPLLVRARELREDDDRHLQLLRHRLDLARDAARLQLAALTGELAAVRELQIVDHDEFDVVHPLHAARTRAHVGDVDGARVVDVDRRAAQGAHRAHQALARLDALVVGEEAALEAPGVHAGAAREHALGEGFRAHFEGEHQDRVRAVVFALHRHAVDVLPERDALGDVHRKRGLADGRAGGDDDHVPRL